MNGTPSASPSIGGLLLLPAAGLVLVPIKICVALVGSYLPLLLSSQLQSVPKPLVLFIWFEVLSLLVLLLLGVLTAVRFFQRTRNAPLLLAGWLALIFSVCLADFAIGMHLEDIVGERATNIAALKLLVAAVSCAAWLTYLAISRRVKQTFVIT